MILLLVAVYIGGVNAKPQSGYKYPVPSTPSSGYGLPGAGSGTQPNYSHGSSGGNSGHSASGYAGGVSFSGGSSSGGFSSSGSGFAIGGGHSVTGSGYTAGAGQSSSSAAGGNFIHTGSSSGSVSHQGGQLSPLIHKHIYVHVAPPELDEAQRQEINAASAAKKHYKIIFIKTPSYASPSALEYQAQGQSQEKTLIYVLVKRPDDVEQGSFVTSTKTRPSKPEVYFIRYKAQQDTSSVNSGSTGGTIGVTSNVSQAGTGGSHVSVSSVVNNQQSQVIGGTGNGYSYPRPSTGSAVSHSSASGNTHNSGSLSPQYGPP